MTAVPRSPARPELVSALPILTILNDPDRAAMYRHLAGQAGVPTIEAEGALHALTQLERMPVAAIICDAQMEDMSGEDFREVVTAEESTHDVPVYVLPQLPEAGNGDAGALPTSPQVLGEVLTELGLSPAQLPVPLRTGAPAHLHGDLSQFSLPEFLNWVAEMRFSGHWLVTVSSRQGAAQPLAGHLVMRGATSCTPSAAGTVARPPSSRCSRPSRNTATPSFTSTSPRRRTTCARPTCTRPRPGC